MSRTGMATRLGRLSAVSSVALGAIGVAALTALGPAASSATSVPAPTMYIGSVAGGPHVTSYPLPSSGNVTPATTLSSVGVHPYGLGLDGAGDLWVSNYISSTLMEFTPAQLASGGTPTAVVTISSSGPSLDGPIGTAFDRSGDLWLANFSNATISMFTPSQLAVSGSPTATVSLSGTDINEPEFLAFDAAGDLWVASGGSLLEYTPAQLTQSGTPVPAIIVSTSSLGGPTGIAFDPAGDAWVSTENGFLAEFTPAMLATTGTPTPAVKISNDIGNHLEEPGEIEFPTRQGTPGCRASARTP